MLSSATSIEFIVQETLTQSPNALGVGSVIA